MTTTKTRPHPKPAHATARRRPPRRRFPVMVVGATAMGALALLAVIIGATTGDPDPVPEGVEQLRDVEVSGTALPIFEAGVRIDPAAGRIAPVLEGATFAGDPISIGGAGEPQLVFFLAHWCPHCQTEVPVVTEWLEDEGMPEGVRLVAVSTGANEGRPNYPPSEWLGDEGWPIPTLADNTDSWAAQAYGLSGFPYFVAIDAEGRVVARAGGELPSDELQALVDAARNGVPGPVVGP